MDKRLQSIRAAQAGRHSKDGPQPGQHVVALAAFLIARNDIDYLLARVDVLEREIADNDETILQLAGQLEKARPCLESLRDGNWGRDTITDRIFEPDVEAICQRRGISAYGAIMDSAARLWARRDPRGALTIGPCRATAEAALKAIGMWQDVESQP